MPLLRLKEISIAFGINALLDRAEFKIMAGKRVGLIGRSGKEISLDGDLRLLGLILTRSSILLNATKITGETFKLLSCSD